MLLPRRRRPRPAPRNRNGLRFEALEARRVLATYFVGTTADVIGTCVADDQAASSNCSIRSAIEAAEANPGADTIEIPTGTYLIGDSGSFDLFEAQDLTFLGTGNLASDVVIDGQGDFRGFDILGSGAPYAITFQNLTIQNTLARDGSGGGAINAPRGVTLTLDNVVLQDNIAGFDAFTSSGLGSSGGAISTSGPVVISNSRFFRNQATESGGALDLSEVTTITNSVFRDNVALDNGGAIRFVDSFEPLQLPTAVDDSFEVAEGSVSSDLNVLDNDVLGVIGGETIINVSAGSAGGQLAIETDGQSVRYTPQPGFNGTEQFTYSIQDDTGATSTATVTVDLLPGSRTDSMQDPNFDLVEFEIEILDPVSALPVPSVQVGDEFLVRVSVDDRRAFQNMPGVASAFLDLLYSDALVSTVRSSTNPNFPFDISFGPLFSGENGFQSGNAQVPGVITEVGAIQPFGSEQTHSGPTELFTLRMQAVSAGTAVFKGDPVDIGGETLLLGANDALEPAQLRLGRRQLLITPGSGGTPASNNTLLSIQDTTLEDNTTGSFTPDGNIFNDFGFGGAVFTRGASFDLDLQRVVVDGNSAGDSGGGIYVDLGAVTSVDSNFTNNQANGDESGGGGLYVFNSGSVADRFNVSGGEFRSNSAVEGAGGFESNEASGVLNNVAFTLNEVTGPGSSFDQGGGAIALISDSLTPTPDVRLQNLQVTQNQAPAAGGIAVVNTDVTISDSTIDNNTATTSGQFIGGGGIGAFNESSGPPLQIIRSSISNNTTAAEAGGIGAVDVDLQITETTIAGNAANGGRAGGVGLAGNLLVPLADIESSTINSNTANDLGGGIGVFNANIQLLNTTITENSAATGGGIAYSNATSIAASSILYSTISSNSGGLADNIATAGNAAINVASSIIANGNCAALPPASLAINSLGANIDSGNSCNFTAPTDLVNTNPLLGELADNGGPVQTQALLTGSPAIDLALDGPSTDARGISRPIDGDGDTVAAFDSGAFEAESATQQPKLTVKDIVVNEDVGFATVTVALDIATAPFQVEVFATDDTTVETEDYSLGILTLSFSGAAGEEVQVPIEIVDDEISEARERLVIQLRKLNPSPVDVSDVGQIFINDDDIAFLSIEDRSASEGDSISFDITLSGDVDTDFDVTALTRSVGSATETDDYSPAFEVLNFSGFDGETQTFTVDTTSDEIVELDETIEVLLTDIETQGRKIRFAGNLQTDLAPLGQFSPAGALEASSVAANGDVAFVAVETNSESQLVALDISQTLNVTPLDTFTVSRLSPSLAIDAARQLLFVSQRGDGVLVLDISNPSNLTQVGSYSSVGSVDQIVLDGNTAYLVTGFDGIEVVDISDPSDIQLISTFDTPGRSEDIQLLGDVALVSDSTALLSLDVSNLNAINLIDQITVPAIEQIDLVGTTLYAATGGFSTTLMEIFDVSNPQNLTLLSTFTGPLGFTDDVVVADGIAFLADQEGAGVLTAVDVTDPVNPQEIVRDDTFFDAHRLAFDDGRLFLNATTSGPGFAVLGDINIATATGTIINDDSATLSINDVSINEDTGSAEVIATLSGGVDVPFTVDMSTEDFGDAIEGDDFTGSSTTLSFQGLDGETQSFSIDLNADQVTELDELFGIRSRNIQASGRSVRFNSVDFVEVLSLGSAPGASSGPFSGSNSVALNDTGDVAYLADFEGLVIYDVSDRSQITSLGSFDTGQPASDVIVNQDIVYLAGGFAGLQVLDVSDPSNVLQLDVLGTSGRLAKSVQQVGSRLYLAEELSGSGRFSIYDLSDPRAPALLGSFTTPASDLAIDGNVAYVAAEDDGLRVLDISDATAITELNVFNFPSPVTVVEVDNSIAYVGTTDSVALLDVSSLPSITPLTDFSTSGQVSNVGIDNDLLGFPLLTVTDSAQNILFFDAQEPSLLRSLTGSTLAFTPAEFVQRGSTLLVADRLDGGLQSLQLDFIDSSVVEILNDDSSTLTIGNTSLLEGDQGTQTMSFAVTLNGAVDTGLTVNAVDIPFPGEAESGVDFQPVNQTLIFDGNDGETRLVNVTIISDEVIEPDETITVELRSLDAGGRAVNIIPPGQGIGTILNDDAGVTVDLAITKTDDIDPVDPGGSITYTVLISNIGSTDATNVSISDQLPSGVTFQSGNVDGDESLVSEDSGQVFAQVGDLPIGASSTLTLVVDVALDAAGQLINQATVSADEVDSDLSNNTVSEETSVAIVLTDDEFNLAEDSATTSFDVLANDLPQDALTISDVTASNLGTITIVGGTSLSFTPDENRFGSEILDYTVDDGFGGQATAQLTISITGINDPPIAGDDLIVATQRDNVDIDVSTLLQNDSAGPFETEPIFLIDVTSPSTAGGTVTRLGDTITYTPPDNFTGLTDSFTYTIADATSPALENSATVTIELPPPPATLSGHIYCDANGNKMEDPGEAVVGTRVFIDENGNRLLDSNERVTFTDSEGNYLFTDLTDASSTVIATVPSSCASIPERPAVSRSIIDVGKLATSITATDIDSDGDLDLGIAADFSDAVTFLVNNGGNFSRLGATPVGARPQNISTNRLEGSSLLAVSSVGTPASEGVVTVLNGASEVRSFQAGNGPIDSVIDDFNNDGLPDIAVATFRTSDVRVLLDLLELGEEPDNAGDDDPESDDALSGPVVVGDAPLVRAIDSGDLDQDGNADIVLGGFGYPNDETSRLGLLLGDGTGKFAEPLFADPIRQLVDIKVASLMEDEPPIGPALASFSLAEGEPSDATPPSILTLSERGELAVFQVQAGSLVKVNSTSVSAGSSSFDVGNFNNDPFLDVAIANTGAQRIDLLIGNGEGRFAPITTITDVSAPSDLVVADLDGDGIDDIAVSNLYRDINTDPQGSPQYRLPSTATILLLNAAESSFVISGGVAATVDFVFQNANPRDQFDVSGDGDVTAQDALQVINALVRQPMEAEAIEEDVATATFSRTDVNRDGRTSAIDALLIINHLTRQQLAAEQISLLNEDDEDEQRIAAIDLILTQFMGKTG